MSAAPQVCVEETDVAARLADLQVAEQALRDAALAGQEAASTSTEHDPPNFKGFFAWARTVRRLRDELAPQGWSSSNARGYATAVNPDETMAIAVASGDEGTGLEDGEPSTRSTKGPATVAAVAQNQLVFFPDPDSPPRVDPEQAANMQTWLLLFYLDEDREEVRLELSLPEGLDDDGYVVSWRERIILPRISFGYEAPEAEEAPQEIEIPIERRAD